MALTPEQTQAAKMCGHGMQYADVAEVIGTVGAATIGRWNRELEEFREAADEARQEDMLSEPEAVAALRRALHAKKVNAKGDEADDHAVQVQAAKALLSRRGVGDAVEPPPKVRERRIYVQPDEDDADSNE